MYEVTHAELLTSIACKGELQLVLANSKAVLLWIHKEKKARMWLV